MVISFVEDRVIICFIGLCTKVPYGDDLGKEFMWIASVAKVFEVDYYLL